MKTILSLLAGIIFLAILLPSCTIEKRTYMPGYNVEWNTAKHKSKPVEPSAVKEESASQTFSEPVIEANNNSVENATASADKKPSLVSKKYLAPITDNFKKSFSQQKEKMNQLFVNKKFIPTTKAKASIEVLPIVSMSTGVVSLVCLIISSAIYSALGVGAVETYLFAVVGVLLGIAACIMGMFGLKKEKDKLSKIFSLVGVITGGIGMIACIIWFWVMVFSDLSAY